MADLPLRKSRWLIPLPCRIRKCEQNKRQDHIYREAEYTSDGSYGGGKTAGAKLQPQNAAA